MEEQEIKTKAVKSIFWKFLERISAQVVSLIVSIILARLLDPTDYSVVSIVSIFFAFANVFISGGLNSALIQKKNADNEDYSTVFFLSLIISIIIYLILFFSAPFIAELYNQQILVLMIRIMGLSLPISAIKSIWCAYISSTLQFRKFFFSTIIGTIISAFVGILMALNGAGAWALIAQNMTNMFVDTLVLILSTKIHIVFKISISKLKILFKYGWKVFISSIIGCIYSESIPLVIGVKYNNSDLAYYTKGRSFPNLITTTTTSTLSAVLFPTLSKFQEDKSKLLSGTRLFIRISSFFTFPLMLGFFAVAENFVLAILTEKWMPIVPYIRIFCIASMFEMVHIGNCETIKAMGKSGTYLIMEIIKKSAYFITIALFLFFGDNSVTLAMAFIVCTFIAIIVNSVPNIKLIGYKLKYQIIDLLPNLIISGIMCVVVFLSRNISCYPTINLLLQILIGTTIYLVLSLISKNKSLIYVFDFLKNKKR